MPYKHVWNDVFTCIDADNVDMRKNYGQTEKILGFYFEVRWGHKIFSDIFSNFLTPLETHPPPHRVMDFLT